MPTMHKSYKRSNSVESILKRLALALLPLGLVAFPLDNTSAQVPAATRREATPPASGGVRQIRAVKVSNPINIDGQLDERVWSEAVAAADFLQQQPNEGTPASEKTEVRVLFDDRNLYLGIRAFDSDPANINARELVRDASFENDDKIEIVLDTYRDRRNAFRFAVNPLGTQQDALITDEGRDLNLSWDAPWISSGKIDDDGWTVEIAIPLTTLRFKEGNDTWGFNSARIIRRKNEENLWTSWQRSFGLERVSQAGELVGVGEIKRRRLYEIKPYVTGGWREGIPQVGSPAFDAGVQGKAGLEVARIGITPSLTAEFTANPDFGQAEVDDQIVNLSRFSVFFPEKRDFFLENAGIFLFGRGGANQLFFTRRIGLTESGEPVPIDYGAKVTGKVGQYNVGFLQVQTRSLGDAASPFHIPRAQFTVARVKRDIFERSSIGAIFVNRQGAVSAESTPYNRGAGIDAEFNLSDHYQVRAFLMGTATPGVRSSFHSGRIDSRFENDLFSFVTVYEDIGENFNPEVGFVDRKGIRQYFGEVDYKPRPTFIPYVRQMEFESSFEYYEDRAGHLSSRRTELEWFTEFKNSATFAFRPIEDLTDVLTEPFEIRPGIVIPPGSYRFNRPQIEATSDTSKRIVLSALYEWGGFYSGNRDEIEAGITFRPNAHLLFEFSESFNKVRLPQGNFTTNLFVGRVNYNFSRKLLTSALMQLNSAARISALNIRLRYIYSPNSDFFVIYNQTSGRGLERPSYSLQFKLTRNFTF